MLSIFSESDIVRLGGGMVITKVKKRGLFNTTYESNLLFDRKIYPVLISIRKFGGFTIKNFSSEEDEKEFMNRFSDMLLNAKSALFHFWLRLFSKFCVLFFSVFLPIYLIRHLYLISASDKVICFGIVVLAELFFYFIQGLLNRF